MRKVSPTPARAAQPYTEVCWTQVREHEDTVCGRSAGGSMRRSWSASGRLDGKSSLTGKSAGHNHEAVRRRRYNHLRGAYVRSDHAESNLLAGRAVVRGLRISVAHVVNLVANGMSPAQIVADLPDLEEDDVRQALAYTAALAQDELHTLRT